MNDPRELIRMQMDETKSQLSDKLQLLKLQIAETACSTGAAVSATVESIKDTTETVQSAAKSVSNALNVRRRISLHPWLTLGTCLGLGYLAGRGRWSRSRRLAGAGPSKTGFPQDAAMSPDAAAATAAVVAAYQKGVRSSAWDLLRNAAIAASIEVIHDVASRVIPNLMDRLTTSQEDAPAPLRRETIEGKRENVDDPVKNA